MAELPNVKKVKDGIVLFEESNEGTGEHIHGGKDGSVTVSIPYRDGNKNRTLHVDPETGELK